MISGSVTDNDGKPLAGIRVAALTSPTIFPIATHTDSQGRYRFPELAVGSYIVRAGPPAMFSDVEPRSGHPEVYYPEAATPNEAIPIRVFAGSLTDAINFRLEEVPLFHIRGHVLGARDGTVGAHRCEANPYDGWKGTGVSQQGEFLISGLLPGTYCINYEYPPPGKADAPATLRVTILDRDIEGSLLSVDPPDDIANRF